MRRLLAILAAAACLLCAPAHADLGYVDQGNPPWTVSGTVDIGNFPATQPVSGTVTANVPNPLPVSLVAGGSGGTVMVQGATLLNSAPTVSAANAAASVSLAGAANQRVCIRSISIYAAAATGAPSLTVSDGASEIIDLGSPNLPLLGLATTIPLMVCGSTGNGMTVNIGAAGLLAVTHTSVIADRQ